MDPNYGKLETLDDYIKEEEKKQEIELNRELIKAFIGRKLDRFTNGSFSIWAFLFGPIYCLYRKMWLLSLGLWGLLIASYALFGKTITSILSFIIWTILGAIFKRLYIEESAKKIERIKKRNAGKSKEELIKICKRRGGTSLLLIVIIIALTLGIPLIMVLKTISANKVIRDSINNNNMIGKLNVEVPAPFVQTSKDVLEVNYAIGKEGDPDYCTLTIERKSSKVVTGYAGDRLIKSVQSSWNDSYDDIEFFDTEKQTINGNEWYSFSYQRDNYSGNYYSIVDIIDGVNYTVHYKVYSDTNKICYLAHIQVINSLALDK